MKGGTGWHDFLDLGNVFGFRITDVYLENDGLLRVIKIGLMLTFSLVL
jgi:hypothetical protein